MRHTTLRKRRTAHLKSRKLRGGNLFNGTKSSKFIIKKISEFFRDTQSNEFEKELLKVILRKYKNNPNVELNLNEFDFGNVLNVDEASHLLSLNGSQDGYYLFSTSNHNYLTVKNENKNIDDYNLEQDEFNKFYIKDDEPQKFDSMDLLIKYYQTNTLPKSNIKLAQMKYSFNEILGWLKKKKNESIKKIVNNTDIKNILNTCMTGYTMVNNKCIEYVYEDPTQFFLCNKPNQTMNDKGVCKCKSGYMMNDNRECEPIYGNIPQPNPIYVNFPQPNTDAVLCKGNQILDIKTNSCVCKPGFIMNNDNCQPIYGNVRILEEEDYGGGTRRHRRRKQRSRRRRRA